ncbi:hypothetical protein [Embleya sp. NPDC059237]|uniref:hypothetical protein n=1 Tax=Embleya sp. NPDC059237 TaxID=3346784 RepID=UPI0036C2BCF8
MSTKKTCADCTNPATYIAIAPPRSNHGTHEFCEAHAAEMERESRKKHLGYLVRPLV